MTQSISCTNGHLLLEGGKVTVSAPVGKAELSRREFRDLLKELEAQSRGLTSENLTGETTDQDGSQVSLTLHDRSGDPQAGSWAELRVERAEQTPVNLQMGTWALRELSQSL